MNQGLLGGVTKTPLRYPTKLEYKVIPTSSSSQYRITADDAGKLLVVDTIVDFQMFFPDYTEVNFPAFTTIHILSVSYGMLTVGLNGSGIHNLANMNAQTSSLKMYGPAALATFTKYPIKAASAQEQQYWLINGVGISI